MDRKLAVLVALLGALLAWSASARALDAVWLNAGVLSLHFDRDKNLRDDNLGLGVEAVFDRDHVVSAGTFINSRRERSRMAAYGWRPLHWTLKDLEVSAGVALAALDGYPNYRSGGWFVAPLPLLAIEGRRFGVNLSVIPTIRDRVDGAIAVQFKLRVW